MPHSLRRELSPKEESTLCRIAQGVPSEASLRPQDVLRLQNFGFVETAEGMLILTPLGAKRVAIVTGATTSQLPAES